MSATLLSTVIKDINAKRAKPVAEWLKKNKDKPNPKYTDPSKQGCSYTLLHKAVDVGDPEILAAFIKAGVDINSKDGAGCTPLHWCADRTTTVHHRVAGELIKAKASVAAADTAGSTPLHHAAACGNTPMVQLLLQSGASAGDSSPGYTPLHAACCSAGLAAIEPLLVADPAVLGEQDAQGLTPLMRLVAAGEPAAALRLLQQGDCRPAATSAPAAGGVTVLHMACSRRAPDLELVEALVAAGAPVEQQAGAERDGDTLLLLALRSANLQLLQLLLQHVKQVYPERVAASSSSSPSTPLALAAAASKAVPELLPAVLAKVTPEELAGCKADLTLAAQLLQEARAGNQDALCAQLIRLLPTDVVNKCPGLAFDPLVAAGLPKTAVAHLVKSTPGGLHAPVDDQKNTLLHQVVTGQDNYGLVEALLQLGVDANAQNADGDTALHVAARANHVAACRALAEGGADALRRNAKNRTPLSQLKLPEEAKEYLKKAEEVAKARKAAQQAALWDEKMRATQTQSAFGVRAL